MFRVSFLSYLSGFALSVLGATSTIGQQPSPDDVDGRLTTIVGAMNSAAEDWGAELVVYAPFEYRQGSGLTLDRALGADFTGRGDGASGFFVRTGDGIRCQFRIDGEANFSPTSPTSGQSSWSSADAGLYHDISFRKTYADQVATDFGLSRFRANIVFSKRPSIEAYRSCEHACRGHSPYFFLAGRPGMPLIDLSSTDERPATIRVAPLDRDALNIVIDRTPRTGVRLVATYTFWTEHRLPILRELQTSTFVGDELVHQSIQRVEDFIEVSPGIWFPRIFRSAAGPVYAGGTNDPVYIGKSWEAKAVSAVIPADAFVIEVEEETAVAGLAHPPQSSAAIDLAALTAQDLLESPVGGDRAVDGQRGPDR